MSLLDRIYDAIDEDDATLVERLVARSRLSCAAIEGLLDRAAAEGRIASISSIIDMLDMRGCLPDLNTAAREAVMAGQMGSTLFLIARGATNYDELIRLAERSGDRQLASLIKQKAGMVGRYRY